jgi:hypothetical protein
LHDETCHQFKKPFEMLESNRPPNAISNATNCNKLCTYLHVGPLTFFTCLQITSFDEVLPKMVEKQILKRN